MGFTKPNHPNVTYAGRHELDMWEQLIPHIDSIENIYFAGGEPLLMIEHYISSQYSFIVLLYSVKFLKVLYLLHNFSKTLYGNTVFTYINSI